MKLSNCFISLFVASSSIVLCSNSALANDYEPRLVVGITVDQMRADFINRYYEHFSSGGFKRLLEGGFVCNNHHFGYAPTYTGPGHASIYTGTTPAYHGIVANDWYSRVEGALVYCASDTSVVGVGNTETDFGKYGKMSPHRLLSSTVSDELKISNGGASKTIGISLKDRGAILPAGHSADGAYWFYGKDLGHFITSSYYVQELPTWVANFNNSGRAQQLIEDGWTKLLPEKAYATCLPDNNPYEGPYRGELSSTFPYDLKSLMVENGGYSVLKSVPAGNTLIVDMALAAIDGENLGADDFCDLLALSFSATDYVGHRCGPHAQETLDMYVRLDRELERLFNALDKKVGHGKWTVMITADHGAAMVPSHGESMGLPTNYWSPGNMQDRIESAMDETFGEGDWIENVSNNSIFFHDSISNYSYVSRSDLQRFAAQLALEESGVMNAIAEADLASHAAINPFVERIYNGHQPGVSGDVKLILNPGWLTYSRTGTSHGSPYPYDTHVPCIFYGAGVERGSTWNTTYIRDIAPTISSILNIPFPNSATGTPIGEAIK